MTIAYPPPAAQRSEPSYTRLTLQKPAGRHDIIKLHIPINEVSNFRLSFNIPTWSYNDNGKIDFFATDNQFSKKNDFNIPSFAKN